MDNRPASAFLMDNRPAFFNFFIPEISGDKLEIPPAFIRHIGGTLPEPIMLRDRYHNLWELKVESARNEHYFNHGWRTFVEENLIKGGELIVFDYLGQGFFAFKIYGSSGFETKGVGSRRSNNTQILENTTNVNDVGHEKQLNDAGAGTSANPNKNRREYDWFGVQIFRSGRIPKPENPHFVTTFNHNRKYKLYIPIEVIEGYKLELPEKITFIDPQGREFQGERKTWKDGRIHYAKGWKTLCIENSVGNEDKCICEFIKREGGKLCVNVSFVRANRQ